MQFPLGLELIVSAGTEQQQQGILGDLINGTQELPAVQHLLGKLHSGVFSCLSSSLDILYSYSKRVEG